MSKGNIEGSGKPTAGDQPSTAGSAGERLTARQLRHCDRAAEYATVGSILSSLAERQRLPSTSPIRARILGDAVLSYEGSMRRFVDRYTRLYGESLREDLEQAARIGVLRVAQQAEETGLLELAERSADRARTSWGIRTRTAMKHEVLQVLEENWEQPIGAARVAFAHRVSEESRAYEDRYGRAPTVAELAERLGKETAIAVTTAQRDLALARPDSLENALAAGNDAVDRQLPSSDEMTDRVLASQVWWGHSTACR